jgi:hypothetical protein
MLSFRNHLVADAWPRKGRRRPEAGTGDTEAELVSLASQLLITLVTDNII